MKAIFLMSEIVLMPDIFHSFPVKASPDRVFEGISTTEGLDNWWTEHSEGRQEAGATYTLDFGPGYIWKAVVTKFDLNKSFELQMTSADADWQGSKVGFSLKPKNAFTEVDFYHTGWPENNEHYRISSYCWAMYLRILKRYIEFGEKVPYGKRLSV
jgi:uncharacterized protein YndB with AHSA1/START domain